MKKEEKKTPLLDPKIENEQNVKRQDNIKETGSKSDSAEKPTKEDADKVPESNDPAGMENQAM